MRLFHFYIIFIIPVGLKYDQIWKKLGDSPHNEGLHVGPVGYRFIIFPSVFKSLDFTDLQVCVFINILNIYLIVITLSFLLTAAFITDEL